MIDLQDKILPYDSSFLLAGKIKKLRKSKKLTQKEISEISCIPLATYRLIEQKGVGSIRNLLEILFILERLEPFLEIVESVKESPVDIYRRICRKE